MAEFYSQGKQRNVPSPGNSPHCIDSARIRIVLVIDSDLENMLVHAIASHNLEYTARKKSVQCNYVPVASNSSPSDRNIYCFFHLDQAINASRWIFPEVFAWINLIAYGTQHLLCFK